MRPAFDFTDLPRTAPETLALAMRLLIEDGRALILLRGASQDDRKRLEQRFWGRYDGETSEGVAALIRLWSLVEVFQSRRIRALFLDRGYALIADAVRIASEQRLNITWGFNPQRMLIALAEMQPQVHRAVRASSQHGGGRLAA